MFAPCVPSVAVTHPLLSIRALQVVKLMLGPQPGSRGRKLMQDEGGKPGTCQARVLCDTAYAQGLFQGEPVCAFG